MYRRAAPGVVAAHLYLRNMCYEMFGLLRCALAPVKIREYPILVRQIENVLQYNPGKSKM